MHCLYGLQKLDMRFELKGGTSLSKGFQIIERFSEDIDIRIEPPAGMDVKRPAQTRQSPRTSKAGRISTRGWTKTIKIDGIVSVERDTSVDNRDVLQRRYPPCLADKNTATPVRRACARACCWKRASPRGDAERSPRISVPGPTIMRLRKWTSSTIARNPWSATIPCYTLVEKLQAISTKFRRQQAKNDSPIDFMRHYYDAYSLLQRKDVQEFIGTPEYKAHKERRFLQRRAQHQQE